MACHSVPFTGYIAWPYLDFGVLGTEKSVEGVDIVCTGEVAVSIGYNQRDTTLATDPYTVDGDTLPGFGMIPIPVSGPSFQVRLTFSASQAWEWMALNLYVDATGFTG